MKKLLHQISGIALASFLFLGSSIFPAQAQAVGQCFDNRAISTAVANGQILSLAQVAQIARFNAQQSHNVRVCQINGQPHYLLDTLDAYGSTRNYVLRATDGAPYIGG